MTLQSLHGNDPKYLPRTDIHGIWVLPDAGGARPGRRQSLLLLGMQASSKEGTAPCCAEPECGNRLEKELHLASYLYPTESKLASKVTEKQLCEQHTYTHTHILKGTCLQKQIRYNLGALSEPISAPLWWEKISKVIFFSFCF